MSGRIPHTLSEAYRIGVESARVNVAPGLLLQAIALALVWAYYSIAPFDQFVYTVLFASIVNSAFNFILSRDLSPARVRADWPASFVRQIWGPNLLANWVVWFPAMFLIYIFPRPLQTHISGLVGCFWTLLCIQIGMRSS